jgi:hypothetical protein
VLRVFSTMCPRERLVVHNLKYGTGDLSIRPWTLIRSHARFPVKRARMASPQAEVLGPAVVPSSSGGGHARNHGGGGPSRQPLDEFGDRVVEQAGCLPALA